MKNLEMEITDNLGYIPDVLGYLASIREFEYSYKYYNLRHPGAIFNVSTNHLLDNFINLLTELETVQNTFNKDVKPHLNKLFKELLNDFFKYYDSSYEIIQSCCKPHSIPKDNEEKWRWLEKNKYTAGTKLHLQVKDDLEYFRKIYNKLKHTSNTFQIVIFYKDSKAVIGYYLEDISSDGSIGPDETIHLKYENTDSGNSFNFILKKMYYLIYRISYELKCSLVEQFKEIYTIELPFNVTFKQDSRLWKELYDKIEKLPNLYFSNEFNQEIPEINSQNNHLIFKIKKAESTDFKGYHVTFFQSGDGFTKSMRMPFFHPRSSSELQTKIHKST